MVTFAYKGRRITVNAGKTMVQTLPAVEKAFNAIGTSLPTGYVVRFGGYPIPQDEDKVAIKEGETYTITDS